MKKLFLISIISGFTLLSCKNKEEEPQQKDVAETKIQQDEDFRPNYHFTPEVNWMNDPNGMFYMNGTYHLFFQYYPDGNKWGPMHWGHATSKDMVVWEEQPIALKPDEKGYIFSGSAVVDKNNSSGFGDGKTPPVIAMFTYHDPEGEKAGRKDYQSQAIAYSLDEGKTWTKYKENPVIKNPGLKDFRDPKITWDEAHKQWLMVLSADDRTIFYTSQNLKDWQKASEFGMGLGAHNGVWECPDFFPMKVEGSNETKWVLIQSLNPGGYNGGSGTQYFVGDFDGKKFSVIKEMKDLPGDHSYWIDYGKDNYAGVTWSNIPESDGRKLFMGWMSNWLYAQEVPTETWRSAMTIARELKLKKDEKAGYRIFSSPVKELDKYFGEATGTKNTQAKAGQNIIENKDLDLAKARIGFSIDSLQDRTYEFSLNNPEGDTLRFGYDHTQKQFYVNRKKSGITDFGENFASPVSTAPRTSEADNLPVEIFLDKTSIEIFYDNGETVMTEIFFPTRPYKSFTAGKGEDFSIKNLKTSKFDIPENQK
ncbi:glycoside hydrolase family 32 protein [Salegentibacter chungangensis]|uniref:Glycoside hydrolase family 32 protein n=1 Tax=Salegentibacter chungangensis TaxID=1335724 RepID=A0ABW3NR26_9FLAO